MHYYPQELQNGLWSIAHSLTPPIKSGFIFCQQVLVQAREWQTALNCQQEFCLWGQDRGFTHEEPAHAVRPHFPSMTEMYY